MTEHQHVTMLWPSEIRPKMPDGSPTKPPARLFRVWRRGETCTGEVALKRMCEVFQLPPYEINGLGFAKLNDLVAGGWIVVTRSDDEEVRYTLAETDPIPPKQKSPRSVMWIPETVVIRKRRVIKRVVREDGTEEEIEVLEETPEIRSERYYYTDTGEDAPAEAFGIMHFPRQ